MVNFRFPLFAGFAPCNNLYHCCCNRKASSAFPALRSHQLLYLCLFLSPVYPTALGCCSAGSPKHNKGHSILQTKDVTQREQWDRWMGCNTGGKSTARVEGSASHRLETPIVNWAWHGCCCQQYWQLSEQKISPSRYQLTVNKFRLEIRRIRNPQKEQHSNGNRERLKSN